MFYAKSTSAVISGRVRARSRARARERERERERKRDRQTDRQGMGVRWGGETDRQKEESENVQKRYLEVSFRPDHCMTMHALSPKFRPLYQRVQSATSVPYTTEKSAKPANPRREDHVTIMAHLNSLMK